MPKPTFAPHIQTILTEKLEELIKGLDKDGYSTVEIGWIFNRTKSRVSQIINTKK